MNNNNKIGKVRVGRILTHKGNQIVPSYKGFNPIIVMTKSSDYGIIGPYCLKDEEGRIMENLWQGSKVYKEVKEIKTPLSRWYPDKIIWQHPKETHVDDVTKEPNELYWSWREKLQRNPEPVRYPVGYNERHKCLYAILSKSDQRHLSYIESRKEIYLPLYIKLVKNHKVFLDLKKRLENGENLLIVEVDGPHEETLHYYQSKYSVPDDFIEDETVLATYSNLKILLDDSVHPFGHGYCLAAALLDIDLLADESKKRKVEKSE